MSLSETEVLNPWKDRTTLPKPQKASVPLAALMLFVCSLAIPFVFYDWVPLIVLVVLFAYIVYAVRRPRAVLGLLLLAVLPAALFSGFSVSALLLALVVGTGCAAYLVSATKQSYFGLLAAVISFAISYFVLQDVMTSLLTLVFIPAGLLLALATLLGRNRTTAVVMTLGGFLAVLSLIAGLLLKEGSAAAGVSIAEYLALLREQVLSFLILVRERMIADLPTLLEGAAEAPTEELLESMEASLRSMLSDELFQDLIATVFNLLPGIAVVVCSIPAYVAQVLLTHQYRTFGMKAVVTPASTQFTMSTVSAVLFLVAFFINLFAQGNSFAVAVVGNLYLMLLPAFCLLGAKGIFAFLAQAQGGIRFFFILLLCSMLCCLGFASISFLGFYGAYQSLMQRLQQKMLQRMQAGAGGSGEDSRDDGSAHHEEKRETHDDGNDKDENGE